MPGKRKVAREQREAALRLAVNGPPPLFTGDAIAYFEDVLSGKISASEGQRMAAADKLLPIHMKLREQRLAIEAEQRREAMRQAWHEAEAQKNRERQQAVETERAAWLRKAKADCSPEEWAHIASLSSEELDAWRRECPFKD
jgi:hypothetical protein